MSECLEMSKMATKGLDAHMGKWTSGCTFIFKPGNRVPSTHWAGGWAPKPVWMLWREKSCCLYQEWNLSSSVIQSI